MKTETGMGCLRGGKLFSVLATALMLTVQLGCGGGEGGAGAAGELTPDQIDISAVVTGVSDSSNDLARLRESFTKDAAPKSSDLKKYQENYFEVDGEIVVTGDTASFPVLVSSYTSEAQVQKQWKAQKVGGKWLLSETPLP